MKRVSQHTAYLAFRLFHGMTSLTHHNGQPLCVVYNDVPERCTYGDPNTQGATVAFNLVRSNGDFIGQKLVESQANMHSIYLRSGGLCNAGGIASYLKIEPWQNMRNWSQGYRCGESGMETINGKPTGVVRVSLGAMSTIKDVDTFVAFLDSEYVETERALQVARFNDLNVHWGVEVPLSPSNDSGFAGSWAKASDVPISSAQVNLKTMVSSPNLTAVKPPVSFAPAQLRTFYDNRPITAGSQLDLQHRIPLVLPKRSETPGYVIPIESLRMYEATTGEKPLIKSQSQVLLSGLGYQTKPAKRSSILKFIKGRRHSEAKLLDNQTGPG